MRVLSDVFENANENVCWQQNLQSIHKEMYFVQKRIADLRFKIWKSSYSIIMRTILWMLKKAVLAKKCYLKFKHAIQINLYKILDIYLTIDFTKMVVCILTKIYRNFRENIIFRVHSLLFKYYDLNYVYKSIQCTLNLSFITFLDYAC